METDFNYVDKNEAWFSSDEVKWINRIHKLKEQFPDLVTIKQEPENNDGCIYCKLPSDWLKIQPKKTRDLTDEQRAAIGAALKAARNHM